MNPHPPGGRRVTIRRRPRPPRARTRHRRRPVPRVEHQHRRPRHHRRRHPRHALRLRHRCIRRGRRPKPRPNVQPRERHPVVGIRRRRRPLNRRGRQPQPPIRPLRQLPRRRRRGCSGANCRTTIRRQNRIHPSRSSNPRIAERLIDNRALLRLHLRRTDDCWISADIPARTARPIHPHIPVRHCHPAPAVADSCAPRYQLSLAHRPARLKLADPRRSGICIRRREPDRE